jgi:hypothetical protein
MPRKKAATRPPMKDVQKAAPLPDPNQLALDFEGRSPAKPKTRAKPSKVKSVPLGMDIPDKPGGKA